MDLSRLATQWRTPAANAFGPWVWMLNRATLRSDAQAGLIGALIVLPQGIAFAALAGLPPAWGLYTSIVPCIVAALAGSSRLMVSGPTNAISLALASMLAPLAAVDNPAYPLLAVAVTLTVGVLQASLGLLRLGAITNFISPTVMLGFMTGAAVLIGAHAGRDLAHSWPEFGVGALTVAVAVLVRRHVAAGQHLLIALVVGSVAAYSLAYYGWQTATVGTLPQALPKLDAPSVDWAQLRKLGGIAFALAIVALGQTISLGRTVANRLGEPFDPNRECLGQGLSNIAGAMFSCMVSSGSINRTAMSEQSGARTPLAAVFSALMVIVLLVLAAPVLAHISVGAIAGLLLVVAWGLIDPAQWRRVLHLDRTEAAIALGTLVATLTFSLEAAVLGGVTASLVTYLYRSARPSLRTMGFDTRFDEDERRPFVIIDGVPAGTLPECPQLKLLRMEGSVYFGAVAHVAEHLHMLRTQPQAAKHLMVMTKGMTTIDLAGADMWEAERLRRSAMGGQLYFHRPRPQVLQVWKRSGFTDRLGPGHIFDSKREAIATIVPQLDDDICARCTARVFDECRQRPGAAEARAQAGP
jgi:sulfate permease, SulP family